LTRTDHIKAILFDKDGTLFDFRLTWIPIVHDFVLRLAGGSQHIADQLLQASGYDLALDRFQADGPLAAGNSADIAAAWRTLLRSQSSTAELQRQFDSFSIAQGPANSVPVCDLKVLFDKLLHKGLILGLATSDCEAAARAALQRFDVVPAFSWICGYDSGHGVKPDPAVVRNFAAAVGLQPAQVAVVGDTLHDLHMARDSAAGLAIAVLTGAVERDILAPQADLVLDSIADLPAALGLGGA